MRSLHSETHLVSRIGWLRAAVLGANDGIVSTASLIVGVAASAAGSSEILIAGIAGLVAGAMSMAAGEYVSVSSQADTEQADLARERLELESQPDLEREELAQLYVTRGVDIDLARRVAEQLMQKDALEAHAREELGISEITTARPIMAALTSALTFAVGALMPLAMVWLAPANTACVARLCRVTAVSRAAWSHRRKGWRGRRDESHNPRHLLGCLCHGTDGRDWSAGGNRRLGGA